MPKTRQQRLAEERAGHPPSPPQHLEDKARASRRTRAKTPSDNELTASAPDVTPSAPERTPSTSRLAGPVVPATQSAMPGEPQALLRIWVDIDPEDSGRPAGDAILQETIPSSRVPELVAFLKAICNQEKNKEKMDATLSENQTRSRPPKAKKRAFRRNPLHATSSIFESQPATTSLDTTTAGDIFSPQAGPPETAPETPQRSNTLATVPESSESVLQTPNTTTSQTLTAEPAPTEPKSRRSSPTSAKDARAKQRRHDASIIKPGQPATTNKNQSDRLPRVRKASRASGETATTTVEEEEEFSDIRPRDRAQRNPRQVESDDPTAAPTIRWPSRSLDRMNQQKKRKRFDDPVAGPDRGTHNLGEGEADLSGNNEEYGVPTREQPSKIRRTSGSREFTSQVAAVPKTPIPITTHTGTYKVPSPGDSDWSDSGSEEEVGNNTAGLEDVTAAQRRGPGPQAPVEVESTAGVDRQPTDHTTRFNAFDEWRQTASAAVTAALDKMEVDNNMAGAAFELGLGGDTGRSSRQTNRYNAFEEWSRTASPTVTAMLKKMEVDNDLAGQAFESGLDKSTEI